MSGKRESTRKARKAAETILALYFAEAGYVRTPNPVRLSEGSQIYRKGWEVRLVVDTPEELDEVRNALELVGFRLARPFLKAGRHVQPVYGADAVDWFLEVSRPLMED